MSLAPWAHVDPASIAATSSTKRSSSRLSRPSLRVNPTCSAARMYRRAVLGSIPITRATVFVPRPPNHWRATSLISINVTSRSALAPPRLWADLGASTWVTLASELVADDGAARGGSPVKMAPLEGGNAPEELPPQGVPRS